MPRDPFPDLEGDGQEPDGWPEDDWDPEAAMDARIAALDAGRYEVPPEGAVQGLFVCLPAEDTDVAGFAQDGAMDTTLPGPLLAAAVHAITGQDGQGLAALSDDQLIGVIGAARRMEARTAWTQLAAVREFAARRPATRDRGQQAGGSESAAFSIFAADELSFAFRLTRQSAHDQIVYACLVAERLPQTFTALAAGRIHPIHVRIIEDVTRVLAAADAARADVILAESAQSKTFGELRAAAGRLVLRLDPDAARRRKEAARKEAHVRRFREDSGNAGMIARELPSDEVLASWQHVDQRAHDLRAAGMPGTLRELKVRAYLDLLQERDSRDGPGGPSGPPDGDGDGGRGRSGGGGPGQDGGPACRPDPGPSIAAQVTITVPAGTVLGTGDLPGEVPGFGLLDAPATRDLVAAAARHPDTRWCVTALHPDGTAAAHGCARGRHPPPSAAGPAGEPPDRDPPPGNSRPTDTGSPSGPDPPPGAGARDYLTGLRVRLAPIARGHCDHSRAETGYKPSRKLEHLINTRNARCSAPGCGRPAARCDKDHTIAWHNGGLTCECNLAPLCRHHHRCKQSQGWKLEQPSPGILVWRTPAGRTYTTTPSEYPI